jgi:virulence-associated protein VapD
MKKYLIKKDRKMLENLRNKFEHGYDDFREIMSNSIILDVIIKNVGEIYTDLNGHEKMEKAIALALQAVQIPSFVAILASDKIVDITEQCIQKRFNGLYKEDSV